MKKRILFLCLLTILFSTGMDGCPGLENSVLFTLSTTVNGPTFFSTAGDGLSELPLLNPRGTIITIKTVKDGGERCEETVSVPQDLTVKMVCTHQVYKEQPVETYAILVTLPTEVLEEGYRPASHRVAGKTSFTWDEIFTSCDSEFGSTCSQATTLELHIWLDPPTYDP